MNEERECAVIDEPLVKKVCDSCGSDDIEHRRWVNVNTLEITDAGIEGCQDNWCNTCQCNTDHVLEEDYIERED